MGRAPCCEKVGLKKGRWTAEEDEILTEYIQANGEGSWRSLPKNAGLLRCGKSCRLRWINYLRADLKRGNITAEEEALIVKLHASFGNRWSLIASHLPGRTDNEIKNYWNSHLSRKILNFRRVGDGALPMIMDLNKIGNVTKKKAGRTSRKKTGYTQTVSANVTTDKPTDETMVPLPSTPDLEKETFSSKDRTALDPYGEDKGRMTPVGPSPCQDSRDGMLGSGGDRERSLVLCPAEARENRNSMLSPSIGGDREPEILGPYQGIDGEVLCFNDVIDKEASLAANGALVLTSSEKRDTSTAMVNFDHQDSGCLGSQKTATSEELESARSGGNGESSDWYSCSSVTSSLDNNKIDWDWQGIVEGHELWDEKDELLSWPWDSNNSTGEDGPGLEQMDFDEQNAMVAWLLS